MMTSDKIQEKAEMQDGQDIQFVRNKQISIDHILESIGSKGRYQILVFVLQCVKLYVVGGVTFMTSFIFFQDPYHCQDTELTSKQCLEYVCTLLPEQRQSYVPEPTIASLANTFGDYRCASEQVELNLMITLMYAGTLLGIFFMSLFGDVISRKIFIIGSLGLTLLGIILTVFATNIWMGGVGMLLAVFGLKIVNYVCFSFTAETVAQKYRQKLTIVLQTMVGIGAMANVFWFYLFRNYQIVLSLFFGLPSLTSLILFAIFAKDTPINLIRKLPPQQSFKKLQQIAKFNQIATFSNHYIIQIKQIHQEYKQSRQRSQYYFTILDLFRYPSLRMMTIFLIFIDCAVVFSYYAPTLMLDQFSFSIYVSGSAVLSSQILASILSYFTVSRCPHRLYASISFILLCLCSTVLIFIWNQDQSEQADVGSHLPVLVFVFLIEFIITAEFNIFVVYMNQLYPTPVRLIGIGFVESFGGVTLMFAAQIISAFRSGGVKIMILFTGLALLGLGCSVLLPETKGKVPSHMIEELKNKST